MNVKVSTSRKTPVTIQEWIECQDQGDALDRIKAIVEAERASQTTAWISLASPEQVDTQWEQLEAKIEAGASLPLRGVPFAVKDNIDAAGFITTAACPAFAGPPATEDAPVVANLKNAGAILLGKTNLDQFATGLVGTRSPYGAVPNSHDPSKVSGGSSSGSAVVVARGVVAFSLGTDTAGSGRVPAGLNNIVGLKPSRGAISARGVVPACRTLDCVSVFAMTTADANTVLKVAESYDAKDAYSRRRVADVKNALDGAPLVSICSEPPWFGQTEQEAAYNVSLDKARGLGWRLAETDFSPLFALANLLYEGPWVAERYEAIRQFVESVPVEDMDPTVRGIIMKATDFRAADAFAGVYKRQELTALIENAFSSFDMLLVPTTPTFPSIADLEREPVLENSRLGTYTNFVNFLDWTALSIPAGYRADGLPFGITLIARTWQEPMLLEMAGRWLSGEIRALGATGITITESLPALDSMPVTSDNHVSLVVVGAHLSGLPLNKDLTSRGATLEYAATTSPNYQLYALASTGPVRKPGLRRVGPSETGSSIQVESWLLPRDQLASFMFTIPHPLGLGSIELSDGSWKLGFICEPIGFEGATDVSEFGGWRPYIKHITGEATKTSGDSKPTGIKKVLIANRGEIAVRIISTLKTMGIASVAIYSQQDSTTPHVRLADEAFPLTGHSVSETYLNSTQILQVADLAKADAVIPGYGFLSEDADFAEAVEQAGMTWIGPTPKQMRDLGLKHTSRGIAAAAGVHVVPGSETLLKSLDEAIQAAEQIGFPLMLKSTAGGGGIGITKCGDLDTLREAWDSTQRLAKANFGNDGVFLEKFISKARHIEVQIIGDGTGKVMTIGERDCSLQRRHQKLVEESPAPSLSEDVRMKMAAAASRLAAAVKYRNVGTVEFIFDKETEEFYFLEVNTRLQVEHPVTESVSGWDLVQCMVNVANGTSEELFKDGSRGAASVAGSSIEVRLYAESPLQQFRPTSGRLLDVVFPTNVRVDTWVGKGTEISSSYDPLIAKLIAKGSTREETIDKMITALKETRVHGIETNLEYLLQLVSAPWFRLADYNTNLLNTLPTVSFAFEVIEAGPSTTVQDYPGRKGLWHAGIPPSGPMDNYSARLANRAVGNSLDAAVLECSMQGPTLKFHADGVVAVTGAATNILLNDEAVLQHKAIQVRQGQKLSIGAAIAGSRMYIAFRGGLDVPLVMGSRSTLELGKFGGFNGRKLQKGDILRIASNVTAVKSLSTAVLPAPIPTEPKPLWKIGAVAGPHGAPDYFTKEGLATLFAAEWEVHYNSNRLGVRLTGPNPQWARVTGGQAGLHPSNIHDSPYSVGSVSFTGDETVVLTCDGPSLGGFVVWCVVAEAEMWKMGQLRPGDRVKFEPMTPDAAIATNDRLLQDIESDGASESDQQEIEAVLDTTSSSIPSAIVGEFVRGSQKITVRQAGDHAMLLVFGEIDGFDLRQSLAIFAFIDAHKRHPISGIEELTPGVCTLHITYNMGLLPQQILDSLQQHEYDIPSRLPSRKVSLPITFDDETCKKAVERYQATIRSEAPWLPSNIQFLQELNGLADGSVSTLMNTAEFLVLGLGDVYMGSPCAIPLDPRQRLMGTKYNPSRSFTPRNAVGFGGQYMCIYATESPGGYQLVGRTVDIWDEGKLEYTYGGSSPAADEEGLSSLGSAVKPWKFRAFDRISFYPVTEAKLESSSTEEMIHIEDGETLDLAEYEAWLETERENIESITQARQTAFTSAPYLAELLRPAPERPSLHGSSDVSRSHQTATDGELLPPGEAVRAMVPGRCFKVVVALGDTVQVGDALAWVESNKMELKITSPSEGRVALVRRAAGELVDANEVLFVIETDSTAL